MPTLTIAAALFAVAGAGVPETAAPAASAAPGSAAECAVLPRPTMRVRLVLERDVPEDLRPLVEATVTTVWRGEGLTVEWLPYSAAGGTDRNTNLWLRVTAKLLGDSAHRGDPTLGTVRFFGAVPHPDVLVSWTAAQEWARRERGRRYFSTFAGARHSSLTFGGFEELSRRAVALAAAHEVGHFVLGLKTHDGSGLMRHDLVPRIVAAVEDRDLILSDKSRRRLRQRLAQGAACPSVVNPVP